MARAARGSMLYDAAHMLGELGAFFRATKKWWLGPIVVFLLLLGLILVVAGGSVLAPFLYPLF